MENSRRRWRAGARIGWFVLTGAALLVATQARASNNCPWLNEATASGLLGGAANGTYVVQIGHAPSCTFIEQSGKLLRTLQVSVEMAHDPHPHLLSVVTEACGSSAPLALLAVGNEAVSCAYESRSIRRGRRVVGRVRDRIFVVTLGSSVKNDPVLTPDMLEIKSDTAAAEISGNLF